MVTAPGARADRVRYLLLSPAAVLLQDCPCREYWQELARPGVHYVRAAAPARPRAAGTHGCACTALGRL